jgi:hypothetical protein
MEQKYEEAIVAVMVWFAARQSRTTHSEVRCTRRKCTEPLLQSPDDAKGLSEVKDGGASDGGDAPRCSFPNEPMTMIHDPQRNDGQHTPSRKDGGRYSSAIEPFQTSQ